MGDSALHSELSPSKRHRWGACPGSIRLERDFPEPPAGKAALEGTRSHSLLEECIKGGVYVIPDFVIGTERTDEDGTWTVDAGQVERVNSALVYIKRQALAAKSTPIAEHRVFPDGLVGRGDMHGTIDVQIPHAEEYELIDYKDGMVPVTVEFNPQMEQYVTGKLAEMETPPLRFRITIIQPKLALKGMEPITSWVISTDDVLTRVVPALIAQGAATDDPNAPLVPGESQCKYCRAKATCPALGRSMNEVFEMFGPVIDVQAEAVNPTNTVSAPQAIAQKDANTLTDDELRRIMVAAPLVRQLIDSVEDEIQRRLENGITVEGFKLVRGRGSRSWALSEEEMVKKLTGMGIPKTSLYKTSLISPAQAKGLTWDKKGEPQKLSDIQLKRMEGEYIVNKAGKPTVAPESDPRESIVFNTSHLFESVEAVSVPPFLLEPVVKPDIEVKWFPPTTEVVPVEVVPDWMAVPSWMQ